MTISVLVDQLKGFSLRPVLCATGIAAVTVGSYYLYKRWQDQRSAETVKKDAPACYTQGVRFAVSLDCTLQQLDSPLVEQALDGVRHLTENIKTEELNIQNRQLLPFVYSPLYCGPLMAYRKRHPQRGQFLPFAWSPFGKFLITLMTRATCDFFAQRNRSSPVLRCVTDPGLGLESQDWPIYCPRSVVVGNVLHEINEAFQSTEESGPSTEDGAPHFEDTPEPYPSDVERSVREYCFTMSRTIRSGESMSAEVKYHHLDLVRGLMSQRWWIVTREYFILSPEDPPECFATEQDVTCIKRFAGRILRVTSYRRKALVVTKEYYGFDREEVTRSYEIVSFGADGVVETENHEETSWTHQPNDFGPHSRPFPGFTGSDRTCGDLPLFIREVPSLYQHMLRRNVQDFPLRLSRLREVFTILMRDPHKQNFVIVAMRVALSRVVQLNGMDWRTFQHLYNQLVRFAQNPANHRAVQAELAEIGICYYNFIDVIFELVSYGIIGMVRTPLRTREGGFLSLLTHTMFCFMPPNGSANRYVEMVQGQLNTLLDSIFMQDLSSYGNPQTLASGVWSLLEHHAHQLMSRLDGV